MPQLPAQHNSYDVIFIDSYLGASLCVSTIVPRQMSHGGFFRAVLCIGEGSNRAEARGGLETLRSSLGKDRKLHVAGARLLGCHIPDFYQWGADCTTHGQLQGSRQAWVVSNQSPTLQATWE